LLPIQKLTDWANYLTYLANPSALGCSTVTVHSRVKQLSSQDFSWTSGYSILLGIVEINAGIFCACTPVAYVVLRRIAANPFVSSLRHYLFRISRRDGSSSSNFESGREKASWPRAAGANSMPNGGGDDASGSSQQGVLPRAVHAPRAHMTGLRNFIGKVGRSGSRAQTGMTSAAQITKMSTLTTYTEVGSVEEEYHRSLRPAVTVTSDTGVLDGRTPPQTVRTINDRQV